MSLRWCSLGLLVALALQCHAVQVIGAVSAAVPTPGGTPLPRFTIDLNTPPAHRWDGVLSTPVGSLVKLGIFFINAQFSSPIVSKQVAQQAQQLVNATVFPPYIDQELQGMAAALGATYQQVKLANLYNELSTVLDTGAQSGSGRPLGAIGCTSIVAQRSNGTVYHARNQDYPSMFANITIDVSFVRGEDALYEATMFAGSVGLSGSAQSSHGWSYSINWRGDTLPGSAYDRALAAARNGAVSAVVAARIAMDAGLKFPAALSNLTSAPLISPIYYTLAGPQSGDGAVVSRNRTGAVDVLQLGRAQDGGAPWFVLQTNDDNWRPPNDDRRAAGLKSMLALGADDVDLAALWTVLSTPPVFASDTLHTELMVPAWGQYVTKLHIGS